MKDYIALLIPLSGIVMGCGIPMLVIFLDYRKRKEMFTLHHQERMAAIFAECRRVLKPDGIMTLMFTHKATGAWDALTTGLIEAGFAITASWPVNTEAEGSLHIKDKSAANSTVFLVCRPRTAAGDEVRYWEDVEPTVRQAVRRRIAEFQQGGIRGVDLHLAHTGDLAGAARRTRDFNQTRRGLDEPFGTDGRADAIDKFRSDWHGGKLTTGCRLPATG